MPKDQLIALDRSARRIDVDGRLHVDVTRISKAAVNPYYGQEIPGYKALGLDPQQVYRLHRDPVELERAAPTFARMPIMSKHIPITVDKIEDDPDLKQLIVGATGSDVNFAAPYLLADLCVWDAAAIAGIETDTVRELSCGYRYVPVMEPGEIDGEKYDGRMTDIRGNHLALVEVGRAGSDVVVADENPFNQPKEITAMKMTKLGRALFAALAAASPVLAQDAALGSIVGNATGKNFDKASVRAKLIALDASLDSNKLDAVLDAILDVEQDPEPVEPAATAAVDESPADKVRAMLSGKVDDETIASICSLMGTPAAEDEDPGMKKEDVDAAMDSMRKDLREAEEARRDVRAVVGDVFGMDSAADIYGFALDHLKINRTGIESAVALRALFNVAATKAADVVPLVALDSAATLEQFPQLGRFGQA